MHEIRDKNENVIARLWLPLEKIESSALQQVYNMSRHPRLHKWVAIMPDVHTGIGATIGAVLPIREALIPAAVGVDIGCGMCSVKTSLKVDEVTKGMEKIHNMIVDRIPLGFEHRSNRQFKDVEKYADKDILTRSQAYKKFSKHPVAPQLGTLGGGNHFIELQKDAENIVWIMLHSGSRNIGNLLASHHIKIARDLSRKEKRPPTQGLDYIDEFSQEGEKYIEDMRFAMDFARQNRFVMIEIIKEVLRNCCSGVRFDPTINIHHNYAAREEHFGKRVWVHRKGATRVRSDITGIIPGSMATPSYIVSGKDNEDSYNSCSHGAGRTMSRREAKSRIDLDDFRRKMQGIYSNALSRAHIDEAPDAYKPIDEVIEAQQDLINITTKLHPIMNIKG